MSKGMPWVDIYPAQVWDEYVVQYKKLKIGFRESSKALSLLEAMKLGARKGHNEFLTLLGQMIKSYHGVEKRDVGTLDLRAGILESIARDIAGFLKKQDLVQDVKQDAMEEARKDTRKGSLGYLLLKLARRAKRKAAYIRELKKHNDNHDKGFKGYDDLMAYLLKSRDQDDDLVALRSDVLMERLDPWHRVFEMEFNRNNTEGASYMDGALKLWMFSKQAHDTPFFVWLEGNYVCTGDDKDGTKRLSYCDKVDPTVRSSVTYLNEGQAMPLVVFFSNGLAYPLLPPQGSSKIPPMEVCQAPSKQPGAFAYVWTKDKLLLCGNHAAGSFHHSSFTSGRKVRCAGMIEFSAGKVVFVSNDSGHYRPGSRHLKNFVLHLQSKGVLHPSCSLVDFTSGRHVLAI